MGLFDKILKNRPKPEGKFAGTFEMLNGYTPRFTSFGGEIYESELVRAAVNAIATHCGKLEVQTLGTAKPALQNKLKHAPNEFQTWEQYLRRLATILYVHNTAIQIPVFDLFGEVSGIYAVIPSECEIVQYGEEKTPYLRYRFGWGETAAIELDACGIMTRFQYRNDFFGESNRALEPTMDLIHINQQGIEEGVKNSASYRFMASVNNFVKPEDLEKERLRFSAKNLSREAKGGGLLLFPSNYSGVKQIETKPYTVDADQMKVIREGVCEYFGVNEAVLTSAAYGDAWSAFYESVIEPFAIQFSEVTTRMLFTFNEQTRGAKVMATANRLQYMTNADKLAVSAQMADRGLMTRNEIRAIWNLPPLEEPFGSQLPVRGEYYSLGDDNNEDGNQSV